MKLFIIALSIPLIGCITMSGTYAVSAYDSAGKPLTPNIKHTAEGRGIYTIRNAFCINYPKAVVVITDLKTGKELKSESPYQCP